MSRTTLFNKNHITITKDTYKPINVNSVHISTSTNFAYDKKYYKRKVETVRCISKLGFYYDKVINTPPTKTYNTTLRIISVTLPKTSYFINYIIEYNDNKINADMRPWDMHEDDKAMPDHYILALKDIIDKILDDVKDNKSNITIDAISRNFNFLKQILYKEIFGSEKGIRFQTNEEKILAHGFDLKTSFRNIK